MLLKAIKEKLNSQDISILYKEVGYNSLKKFILSLEKLKSIDSIYNWIYSGHYDLVFNAKDFLINLCDALKIDKSFVNKEIQEVENFYIEQERFKNSYIFINTNFKRNSEPIIALALCERFRRISLYKNEELLFKSKDVILKIVSDIIHNHYTNNKDGLVLWGKIENYVLHLFREIYAFDTAGNLINSINNISQEKAVIIIKNKELEL